MKTKSKEVVQNKKEKKKVFSPDTDRTDEAVNFCVYRVVFTLYTFVYAISLNKLSLSLTRTKLRYCEAIEI